MDLEEEVIHDPNGETLILEAKMQPLLLDSMTKSKDGFLGVKKTAQNSVLFLFLNRTSLSLSFSFIQCTFQQST